MQVSDKLIKPLTEAKYLNADNVSRYRCIMRIFFEHYEKLKYWLYQEEVYEEMIKDPSETIRRYGSRGLLPPTLYISNPMYEKKERPHAGIR